MQAGTVTQRIDALKEWLFNEDTGLDSDLAAQFYPAFINNFLFTEIGFETPYLFRQRINAYLFGKAAYYNRIWELNKMLTSWNPLEDDIDYHEKDDTQRAKEDYHDRTTDTDRQRLETDDIYSNVNTSETQTLNNNNKTSVTETGNQTANGYAQVTRTGQDTESGENGNLQITNEQKGTMDFPQASAITGTDYYSRGEKNSTQDQNTVETTKTIAHDTADTTNSLDKNQSSRTSSGTDDTIQTGENTQESREERNDTRNEKIKDMLKELLTMTEDESQKRKNEKHGRLGRRPVPEIIKQAMDGYIHVPMIMCNDMEQFFMSIW